MTSDNHAPGRVRRAREVLTKAPRPAEFEGLLDQLTQRLADAESLSLGALLETIGARGFGPILVLSALLLIFPVGMIPGMPLAVATIFALVGLQMLLGRRRLRLPARLNDVAIGGAVLRGILRRLRRPARWLGTVLRPRLTVFSASWAAEIVISIVLFAIAAVITLIGFIPGLPFVLSVPVLLLGLGLTARDGLAVLIGLASVLPGAFTAVKVIF